MILKNHDDDDDDDDDHDIDNIMMTYFKST